MYIHIIISGVYMQILIFILAALIMSCSNGTKEGKSPVINVSFENSSSTSLNAAISTKYFGFKLMLVHIRGKYTDKDQQVASNIYIHPTACEQYEQETSIGSGEEQKSYKYMGVGQCDSDKIDTFFNLARKSNEVSADIVAQNLPIVPGTYDQVTMEFCQGALIKENLKFQGSDMSEPILVKHGKCGISTTEAESVTVNEGEVVNIKLVYDLTGIISTEHFKDTTDYACDVTDPSSGKFTHCVKFPTIRASVVK